MKNAIFKFILIATILSADFVQSQAQKTEASEINQKKADSLIDLSEATIQKIEEVGHKEAEIWFKNQWNNPKFNIVESNLNQLGYQLLYERKAAEFAIAVFSAITSSFPLSGNAYDSLGEAYLNLPDYTRAIENYRKAADLLQQKAIYHLGFEESNPYNGTKIDPDTLALFEYSGNMENEKAYLFLQGGPDIGLNVSKTDPLHLMSNDSSLLRIYPKQAQIVNPGLLKSSPTLTEDQSAHENAISVDILSRTISHLKNQGKKVYLLAHSYGASIALQYLASGTDLTDRVVIMGLDLDEDIQSWSRLEAGEYIRWENGLHPIAKKVFGWVPVDFPKLGDFNNLADNLTALVKYPMQKKYTELLPDSVWDKLITVTATRDEANGQKTKEELDFLMEKGVPVIQIDGDHHSMLKTEVLNGIFSKYLK